MSIYAGLLRRGDPRVLAQHSTINHHVDGMHYLCLYRAPQLTLKIYFIEQPTNPHAGFLVHPHSHRYAFRTTVLHGALQHIRFTEAPGEYWDAFEYDCDAKRHAPASRPKCGLAMQVEDYVAGGRYAVESNEIHTLKVGEGVPLVLGLSQFEDERKLTNIYLSPEANGEIKFSNARRPTPEEYEALAKRVLTLLDKETPHAD